MARARAVFDASVLARTLIDDAPDAHAWVTSLRDDEVRVMAPDLIYAEVASALLRQVKTRRLGLADAVSSLATVTAFSLDVRPNRGLCELALALAPQTGLSPYDAHYLALAEAEDAVLVTADRTLAAAASRSSLLE